MNVVHTVSIAGLSCTSSSSTFKNHCRKEFFWLKGGYAAGRYSF